MSIYLLKYISFLIIILFLKFTELNNIYYFNLKKFNINFHIILKFIDNYKNKNFS